MTKNMRLKQKLELLRQAIREGMESGEPTPWDVEDIKREGRERRAVMDAAIAKGIASADAGRVHALETVRAELTKDP